MILCVFIFVWLVLGSGLDKVLDKVSDKVVKGCDKVGEKDRG